MRSEIERAELDLRTAIDYLKSGDYNLACLQAQQVAYSLEGLIGEDSKRFSAIKSKMEVLTSIFLPTCYTNALVGNPTTCGFYEREDAEKCIDAAESILNNVKKHLRKRVCEK